MKTVFFYGLFMDAELLKSKGLNPSNIRLAHVPGYGLRIGERATLELSAEERAYGAAMMLRDEDVEKLYSEPSVADYVPIQLVAVDIQDQSFEAVSYILPMDLVSGSNREYANALALLADKIGLPRHYIDEIRAWI